MLLGLFVFSNASFATNSLPDAKKVMIVVMENFGYKATLKVPYFKDFRKKSASMANFHAETHPSQNNYGAMVAGSHTLFRADKISDVDTNSIVDLLEAKGLDWKIYAEDYPGNCFLGATAGNYVRRHNPIISFKSTQTNPARCARIVNSNQLETDILNNKVPAFSMYIPDVKNDGHDTGGAAYAADFMKKYFEPKFANPNFMKDMLFILTFDESGMIPIFKPGFSFSNKIFTAFYGSMVQPGIESKTKYNHYNMLRTIEDMFQIGNLGKNDSVAEPITDIWK